MSMNQRERDALDRHITGNYGEDQLLEDEPLSSTLPQLRMHAGASDTHIPRPLLERAADELDDLYDLLKRAESLRPKLLKDFGYVPEYVLEFCNAARAAIARKT